MRITWANYKTLLPETLWPKYVQLAQSKRGEINPIIYVDGAVRFADAGEL